MTSTSAPKAKVVSTYDDYRTLPDDGRRYEVIDGELFVSPAPTTSHQRALKRLLTELVLQLERTGKGVVYCAPVDVIFSKTRTVQPDLVLVDVKRRGMITERGIEGAPDVVVEILSPSTTSADKTSKHKLYASEGVREYWIADPDAHTIEVLELGSHGYTPRGVFGPGARLDSGVFLLDIAIDAVFAP